MAVISLLTQGDPDADIKVADFSMGKTLQQNNSAVGVFGMHYG
tara:strand:+ start:11 stop:139 length:129 start_codon:yes stop_codon:yes gene_type:complete